MKLRRMLLTLLVILPILVTGCTWLTRSWPHFDFLKEKFAAGEAPDLAYIDGVWAPGYIDQSWLRPIPGELMDDDFYPQLLEYFQRDGQTYALPHNFQTVQLLVNSEMFEKAGLDPPTTWDEFRETAQMLTNHDEGVYGIGLTSALWNFLPALFQAGGSLLDESGTQLTLDTPEAIEALSFYTDLTVSYEVAYVVEGEWPTLGEYDEMLQLFSQGKIAMFFAGPNIYKILKDQGLPVQVVESPAGPAGKATVAHVRGYGLFRDADTGDPALDLLRFATSQEGMKFWIGDSETPPDYMPARQSLRDEWLEVHPDTVPFMAGVDYIRSYQPATASTAAIAEFDQLAAKVISQALHGEISAEEALGILQEKGNAILEEEQ